MIMIMNIFQVLEITDFILHCNQAMTLGIRLQDV